MDNGKSTCQPITDLKANLIDWFTDLHKLDRPDVDLFDYGKVVKVCNTLGQTIQLTTPWSELFHKDETTVSVVIIRKSWSMAPNFDEKRFTAICPITLEKCDDPTCCMSCLNAFERKQFHKLTVCPNCRSPLS